MTQEEIINFVQSNEHGRALIGKAAPNVFMPLLQAFQDAVRAEVTVPKLTALDLATAPPTKENTMLQDMSETFAKVLETVRRKNNDYSGETAAVNDPFKNFKNSLVIGVPVEKGILVRLMDKMSRISNLLTQEAKVKDEAIADTIDDAISYFAILSSYLKRHPKAKN
jgi:hypothetical protein